MGKPSFGLTSLDGKAIDSPMDVHTLRDKAGGIQQLARAMQVHPTTVQDWLRNGRMPGLRAIRAGEVFGLPLKEVSGLARKHRVKGKPS